MTTFTYDTTVPAANHAPKNDQPTMQQNTNSISGLISVDHVGFNTPNGGYHTIIHQPTGPTTQNFTRRNSTAFYTNTPATITGVNQVLAGLYTPQSGIGVPDTQLFSINGTGIISQLTGHLTGVADSADGWQWLGGILIQWGFVALSSSPKITGNIEYIDRVTGAIPFPNFCYAITTTLKYDNSSFPAPGSGTANTQNVSVNIVDRKSFNWNYTGSSAYTGFYWVAIGS